MTFDAKEKSIYSGIPIEVYRFVHAGTILRYTSCDSVQTRDVGVGDGSQSFAVLAITHDEPRAGDVTANEVTITFPLTSELALILVQGSFAPVTLQIFRYHDGDSENVLAFSGTVQSVRFDGQLCHALCAPVLAILRRKIPPKFFQKVCNHALYDAGCTVNRNSFKDVAVLTFVGGVTIKSTTFATHADGWYTTGYIETIDGARGYITNHVGDTITLLTPLAVSVGASVSAFAGCDRTEATCIAKFNNIVNHWGFARVPDRNPHETGMG